ncbi:MAG: hypothetical protein JSU87_15015 [Gemmatimonadota bacterium]|nr:MAG: hypothetical protein JSU87_15015 [Gemmatimonadota bacterium]
MPDRISRFAVCTVALALAASAARPAQAQQARDMDLNPMFTGYTLLYGSGGMMAPHAYLRGGQWELYGSAGAAMTDVPNDGREIDEGGAVTFTWMGLVEGGVTAYSPSDYGIHAKGQVIKPGAYWPAVSVGALNLLGTSDIGRHGVLGAGAAYENYFERLSPYMVASYTQISQTEPISTTISVGWGYGHFFIENEPLQSNRGRSYGFFGSAIVDIRAAQDVIFRVILEHDAWDLNLAGAVNLRGFELAVGVLAVEEGGAEEGDSFPLNQARPYLRVGGGVQDLRALFGS